MKIYAVSDIHGNLSGITPVDCDIVVIAGDIAPLKKLGKWHVNDQLKWIKRKFIPWTQEYPDKIFVIIPGNHDIFADINYTARWTDLDFRIDWPGNVRMLINSGCEINGVRFWGSPNVPIISYSWAFESEHDRLEKMFGLIPEGLDVLITHSPPHISGIPVDISLEYGLNSQAFGSSELAEVVFNRKPKYLFCGHIHSGDHLPYEFGNTTIYNVSRVDESYEIAYHPIIIDI